MAALEAEHAELQSKEGVEQAASAQEGHQEAAAKLNVAGKGKGSPRP